jgi:hypothetical protein
MCQGHKVILKRSNKDRRVIGVEGSANRRTTSSKSMEVSIGRGQVKKLLQWVNGKVK